MSKARTAQHSATHENDKRDEGEEHESESDATGAYPPAYPLFREHSIEFGLVDYLIVQRVIDDSAARPGADKRTRYKTWPERFDPITTDEITIAERCGGGVYDVRAIGAKGRTVAALRIELDGPPREYVPPSSTTARSTPGAAPLTGAVQQAAPGVLAVAGLDPNVQALITMIQGNNERFEKQLEAQRIAMQQEAQRVREDANSMSDRMVRMVEATVQRTAPVPPIDQQLLMRMLDRYDRQRERDEERAERRARLAARESERDDESGVEKVLEKVIEKGPELMLSLPGLQKRLAELIAPMFKDTAKEIVAGVLNEMAQETKN